jgi:tetratricopeptide (TPR) repeat protein/HEAT repeat protein
VTGAVFFGCILVRVRFGVRVAVGLAGGVAVLAGGSRARGEWEVRRTHSSRLPEQATGALLARPDDEQLARQLIRLAGPAGTDPLRGRFQTRANAPDARYGDVAAYATLLAALGAHQDAAEQYARAALLRPTDPSAFLGRARALTAAGHRSEALEAYDEALQRTVAARARRPILEKELMLLSQPGDLARELAIRRELAGLEPHADAPAENLADVLARLGRPGDAAEVLEARLASGHRATRLDLALRAAELRDAAGERELAAAALAALLRQLPQTARQARLGVWLSAVKIARHRDALPELAETLARDPGPVEWDVLGQVRDELGDLEGALEAARAAARQRPSVNLARRILELLDRLGRDDDAATAHETLARLAPHEPRWTLELVERALRRGHRKQGEDVFDSATARFGRNLSALVPLAELASRWGEDQRALATWERVRRLAPRDERGILGLGETQFAQGKKLLAVATWQALRGLERSPVAGHLRLGDVLLEHDLLTEALAEAQQAQALTPKQARPHRLLAQIMERQAKHDAAVREWDTVLDMSTAPDQTADRREARARILALLFRWSRGRLDERLRLLEGQLRRDPGDRETALFLAEAQQRTGNQSGAVATLRAIVDHDAAAAGRTERPGSSGVGEAQREASSDVALALVRLLRASGQTEEAVRRLEEFVRRFPARAREAHVQLADVELSRHDEALALSHAEQAARLAPADGQALARIAAIQERAGDEAHALDTYRQAFEQDGNAPAAFALARLLQRRGAVRDAADVLRRIFQTATDDEVIVEAGRRAMEIEEYLGHLPEMERAVASVLFSGPRGPTYRRVFVDILRRLLPPLYRAAPDDGAATAERTRLAQHGLRPLIELVTDADVQPDRTLIDLLGMLGNKDAAPVLARIAAPATDRPRDDRASPTPPLAKDAQIAAVIALGRLGDERGREVLEKLVAAPEAPLRAAAVWALGRLADSHAGPLLTTALRDGRAEVAAMACLGIGRLHGQGGAALLAGVAADVARPVGVRRAAIAGMALSNDRGATPALLALAESGDEDLERSAIAALGVLRDPRALPLLLTRALVVDKAIDVGRDGDDASGGDETPAVMALELWATGGALPDEGRAIDSPHLDLEAILSGLTPVRARANPSTIWLERTRDLGAILNAALARPGPRQRRALEALDSRQDGPGLGPLVPGGVAPLPAATLAAVREVANGSRDRVATLMDDANPEIQALALSVLAKIDDARVTPDRLAVAAASAPPLRNAAILAARRRVLRAPGSARSLAQSLEAALGARKGWESRLGLVDALAVVGVSGAPVLERALRDPSPMVRAAAADALATAPDATRALVGAAGDPSTAVRAAVARALVGRPGEKARAALERLSADESPGVRREAAVARPAPAPRPGPGRPADVLPGF